MAQGHPVVYDESHSAGVGRNRTERVFASEDDVRHCLMRAFLQNVTNGERPEDAYVREVDLGVSARVIGLRLRTRQGLVPIHLSEIYDFVRNHFAADAMGHTLSAHIDEFGYRFYYVRTCAGRHDFRSNDSDEVDDDQTDYADIDDLTDYADNLDDTDNLDDQDVEA